LTAVDTAYATHHSRRSFIHHGHALIIDGGWREVANTALAFV
jgi:hypothetical protein